MSIQGKGQTMTTKPDHDNSQGKDFVIVSVDNEKKSVHRGAHVVSEFKKLVGVDESKDLDQIIDGQITPLKDADKIVIKGGEVFISHVRSGASS